MSEKNCTICKTSIENDRTKKKQGVIEGIGYVCEHCFDKVYINEKYKDGKTAFLLG